MENGNLKVAITKSFLDDLDALFAKYHLNDRRMEKIVLLYTQICVISSTCEMNLMVELRLR